MLFPLSTWHSTPAGWSQRACVFSPVFCPVSGQSQPYLGSALPSSLSSADKLEASAPDTRHLWLVSDRVGCPGWPLQHHLYPFTSLMLKREMGSIPQDVTGFVFEGTRVQFPVSGEIALCCHLPVHIGTATPNPENCLSTICPWPKVLFVQFQGWSG